MAGCALGDEAASQAGLAQGYGFSEAGMATHSSIPAWRLPGQRSLVGYSP